MARQVGAEPTTFCLGNKTKMQARVCLLVYLLVVSCIPTLRSLLKTRTFLSRLSSLSRYLHNEDIAHLKWGDGR